MKNIKCIRTEYPDGTILTHTGEFKIDLSKVSFTETKDHISLYAPVWFDGPTTLTPPSLWRRIKNFILRCFNAY